MNVQILDKRIFKDSTQTNIQISTTNKTMITINQVEKIINKYKSEGVKKIIVRGLNIDRWVTLKSYDGDLNIDEIEDYYINKVHNDHEKYINYYQIQLSVFMPKK